MSDDLTARERAVKEAREQIEIRTGQWVELDKAGYRLRVPLRQCAALDALILAARQAERARGREAVERVKTATVSEGEPFDEGWEEAIDDAIAVIDALPETP